MISALAAYSAEIEAQPPSAMREDPATPAVDVKKLFATQCGWCHADYGMKAGKGPQLAGTQMTEQQVRDRIRDGKPGAMPSFRKALSDDQIAAFANYIKSLKPGD